MYLPYRLASLLAVSLFCACKGSGGNSLRATEGEPEPPPADTPVVTQTAKFAASDGAQLHVVLRGTDELSPKPLIVEFSPYGGASGVPDFGPAYNYAYVHARGTGSSTGVWGAVGSRDQQDVAEFLEWACQQPWSNGHIGLYGFSASAIAVYNSLHLPLACVDAAALMAGTNDLYRDLLYPGGMLNIAPAVVVGFGVGLPILLSAPDRLQDQESSPPEHFLASLESGIGLQLIATDLLQHPTEDEYWLARTQRPGPNRFPVLANTGFYDVESRGPFQSYQMLRDLGVPVHLRVFGAHDGFPANTPGPFPEYQRWFDRYLGGVDNGIEREPRVQLLLGHGSYEAQLAGAVTKLDTTDWPVPGTRWQALYLDPARGGGAYSTNDGTLAPTPSDAQASQPYLAVTSLGTATDPNTTATVSNGAQALFTAFPFLTYQLALLEPLSLTYTTPAFSQDVDVVGPASLDVFVATVLPEADLYAVVADVWPDGFAHPVGIGRLRTSYPEVVAERSLVDANGEIVQPYPDHSTKTPAAPGETREYHVEFWPIGNRFQAGHRLRLYLVGAPNYILPTPGVNLVSVGGATPSRLLLPQLPGSDFCTALGTAC